jgi:hypothetical protein
VKKLPSEIKQRKSSRSHSASAVPFTSQARQLRSLISSPLKQFPWRAIDGTFNPWYYGVKRNFLDCDAKFPLLSYRHVLDIWKNLDGMPVES